ncbi:MAG: response regulator [Candidatus Lindowbacteria bacterium]|nr:response regulator [Candidatus Lindowbacteria bacterium]
MKYPTISSHVIGAPNKDRRPDANQPLDKSIIIVDDDEDIRHHLSVTLHKDGWTVLAAKNGTEALTLFHSHRVDVVLTELFLPGLSGIEIMDRLLSIDRNLPVIIFTSYPTLERCRASMRSGATDFLQKLCSSAEIKRVLTDALDKRRDNIR